MAIVSSCLFGSISGSAVANVVTTGQITIPLMKKTGYSAVFAGAVESAASTGGQLMPPIMGAAAFIMAEIIGTPYIMVAKAAVIPSLLFFAAIFFSVDAEAMRLGLRGIPRDQIEKTGRVLKTEGILIIPIVLLIIALGIFQMTLTRAALLAIAACCAVGLFKVNGKKKTLRDYWLALKNGGEGLVQVAVVCACAGIIVGTLTLTGLGMKLGYILVELAAGRLLPLLILTMVVSLILGMGVPTTACYIIMATVVAPALIRAGVQSLPAHLFVFYFGILSVVTPPVALAAYAAAGISGASPIKTGFVAWKISLPAYLYPLRLYTETNFC
jgi:TRAP transporter 4TM/12TM fusion protein